MAAVTGGTVHQIAVVGCGNVSAMHFDGYNAHPERVRVVTACDPVPERRAWAEQEHGVPRTFASVEDLLGFDSWDVAVVCTPSAVREPAVAALAGAGKHVMTEKPLADTYAEARRLVELCADAGVLLAVNQNFRDHYAFGIAARLIADGEIGAVRGISQLDLMFRQDQGWRIRQQRHALSVMGVHWLDGFRQLIAADATRVLASTFSSPAIDCAGETDAFVQIDFGSVPVTYVQSFSSRVTVADTIVVGEQGTLRFGYDKLIRVNDAGADRWDNPYAGPGKPESTFRSLNRLLDAIDAGQLPSNSGQDNLKTIALLEAAYASADSKRPVELSEGLPR
ncbi:MAG TPA: Gfo/Idh/MocA family oxidoreductase [Streptosporangiaceae bacterium]|nr:Gfo/Idh/MocA family oxidoreductase [Streptosporangiaceae bacterium]